MIKDELEGAWIRTTIGNNVRQISAGATPSTSVLEYWENGTIPWMSSGEIHKKPINITEKYITNLGLMQNSTKLIEPNHVLIALAGQGKTRGSVTYNTFPLCTNQSIAAIKCDEDKINYKYLYYLLHHDYYKIRDYSSGDGRGGLNLQMIREYPIKLIADIENQASTVALLSQIDNLILLKKDKITTLTSSRKYLASKIIKSYDSEEFLLKDLIEYISTERVVDTKNYEKLTVSLHKKGLKKITNTTEKKDTRPFYIRRKNEIIIGKQNYFNGSIALISEEFDKCIASNAIVSFKLKKHINPNYVFEILSDSNYYRKKEMLANGTGQKELSESELIKFNINLPSLHIQNLVSSFLSQMDKLIAIEEKKLEQLEKMKKYHLQQFFN